MNAAMLPEGLPRATVTAILLTPLQLGKAALNADVKHIPATEHLCPIVPLTRVCKDIIDYGAHARVESRANHSSPGPLSSKALRA